MEFGVVDFPTLSQAARSDITFNPSWSSLDFYNHSLANEKKWRRIFRFAILPHLSYSRFDGKTSGFYFADQTFADEHEGLDRIAQAFSIRALSQSSLEWEKAAARIARKWLFQETDHIVNTIFRLEYEESKSIRLSLRFHKLEEVDDLLHFVFVENAPGLAHYNDLWQLRENLCWGPDTWDGGDFGTLHNPDDGSTLRVALAYYGQRSAHKADWDPPLPEIEQGNCMPNPDPMALGDVVASVFLVFAIILLWRFQRYLFND